VYRYDSVDERSDKDWVARLCDRVEASLNEGLLPVEVFGDTRLFRTEMERIFTRSWVFVAHETEIPNKGDFVLRKIGLDPVIVTRSTDGNVNVLLNHCRHRGTELCYEDAGNTSHFKCPYHGWIYKNNGDFVGAPNMTEAYGGKLDSKKWGLLRAPRVESLHGFIFACLATESPSLREYLGGAAWMFDAIAGLHPDGMKVLAPPERFVVRADWKSGSENFAGDAWHVATAHYSITATKFIEGDIRETAPNTVGYLMGNGHCFLGHRLRRWFGPAFEYWGFPPEQVAGFDLSKLDATQREMLKEMPPTIGNIFPNFSYLRFPSSIEPGGLPMAYTNIHQWQPLEPGIMEVWVWQMNYSFMPESYNRQAYHAGQVSFSSAGIAEQDDSAVWEGIAKVGCSPWARKEQMRLNYAQNRVEADATWKGPGKFFPSGFGEYNQEAFWRRWLKDMRDDKKGAQV
jgi:N,N-dimethyl phenylurea N-demethylase alpha subunit